MIEEDGLVLFLICLFVFDLVNITIATEVSVLSYLRKEMKPLFSDMFYVCYIWKERFVLFDFVIFGKRDLFCLISRSFCGH